MCSLILRLLTPEARAHVRFHRCFCGKLLKVVCERMEDVNGRGQKSGPVKKVK